MKIVIFLSKMVKFYENVVFAIKCAYFRDPTTLELFLEHELFLNGSTKWFKSLILSLPAVHFKSADLFFYSLIA